MIVSCLPAVLLESAKARLAVLVFLTRKGRGGA